MRNKLAPINAVDADFAQQIFDLMMTNPGLTEGQIARQLKTFPRAVKPMLDRMVERGCVTKKTTGFVRTYSVTTIIEKAARQVTAAAAVAHKPLSTEYMKMMQFAMRKR